MVQILRQYALLASLVRKVFHLPKEKNDKRVPPKSASEGSLAPPSQDSDLFTGQKGLITLSNVDPNEDKLNSLLGGGFSAIDLSHDDLGLSDSINPNFEDVKVDVTLRTQLGQAPALMLLITDLARDPSQSARHPAQVSLYCEIGLNGRITVVDSAGLVKPEAGEYEDTEMQGADDSGPKLQDMHNKISRVLEISQDLGILVEWVLRCLRQRAASG